MGRARRRKGSRSSAGSAPSAVIDAVKYLPYVSSVISGASLLGRAAVLAEEPLKRLFGIENRDADVPPRARSERLASALRSGNRATTRSR